MGGIVHTVIGIVTSRVDQPNWPTLGERRVDAMDIVNLLHLRAPVIRSTSESYSSSTTDFGTKELHKYSVASNLSEMEYDTVT